MLNAAANMLNISLMHTMQTANMTLSLNLFMVAHFCIQLGRACKYTQRYGLKEHSLILDVDFSCSEVRCQTSTANESQVFEY